MAQIVRVFAALAASPDVADYSLDPADAANVRIRVTCEASASEFAGAQLYALRGFVEDIGNNQVFPLAPTNGNLTDANWPTRNNTFTLNLPAGIQGLAAAGGCVVIKAILRVGAAIAGADVDFGESEFVWVF